MGGWLGKLKNRKKDIDRASGESEEKHEEGTPRQNKRQCIHLDPVTKQPMHPEGHDD